MVTFVTTNEGKVREARAYLNTPVTQVDFDYPEIQADNVAAVAAHGARAAYRHVGEPVIVDDSGLTINALNGFPGPYSSYVQNTLGIERVWELVRDESDRSGAFRGVVAYCDGDPFNTTPESIDTNPQSDDVGADSVAGTTTDAQASASEALPVRLFEGVVSGTVVAPRGSGGFGYDPIFEYDGKTFAEMDTDGKNAISHRGRALAKFAEWYETERA